ncbi:MAG TPA: NADH-quinone oxidoreductase subunit N [Baekduia sp.]|nr:NADH-quinone oxidoreductase subunit N [Baekduia sp.]
MIATTVQAPTIDWAGLTPLLALLGGAVLVLLAGLLRSSFVRRQCVPVVTIVAFGVAIASSIITWGDAIDVFTFKGDHGPLVIDDLTNIATLLVSITGIGAVLLAWRDHAAEEAGHGEFYALLLTAASGMVVLAGAQNLVTVFVGYELLSIPLYVLCATELRRASSLESGLKYLIVGSIGSATLLYGLAFIYGATGDTNFDGIAAAVPSVDTDVLLLTGIALALVGIAFKASIAPFHQWTPDVYEGAPTPITAFMAVATKVAAFVLLIRLFDVALVDVQDVWAPALATLCAATILVGNVGALGQSSLKRMLAWSSIAQAGYIGAGVVVGSQLGVQATLFYLAVYLVMNVAAFTVIVARERETDLGDDLASMNGLGTARPLLALPMTVALLGLAGIPATAGFIGKFFLIDALVDGDYAWLGVVIVIGSMISLGYYLRVIAAMWMAPVTAGTDERRAGPEVYTLALVAGAATLVFGILVSPLMDVAEDAAKSLGLF